MLHNVLRSPAILPPGEAGPLIVVMGPTLADATWPEKAFNLLGLGEKGVRTHVAHVVQPVVAEKRNISDLYAWQGAAIKRALQYGSVMAWFSSKACAAESHEAREDMATHLLGMGLVLSGMMDRNRGHSLKVAVGIEEGCAAAWPLRSIAQNAGMIACSSLTEACAQARNAPWR